MPKKNTIIFSTVLLFSVLNFAPFFMIECTESDGNNHSENIFNRCCKSSMTHMEHTSTHSIRTVLGESHCKCSVNISSSEYLITNYDKNVSAKVLAIDTPESSLLLPSERVLLNNPTESPPISINLVRTTVLLI